MGVVVVKVRGRRDEEGGWLVGWWMCEVKIGRGEGNGNEQEFEEPEMKPGTRKDDIKRQNGGIKRKSKKRRWYGRR